MHDGVPCTCRTWRQCRALTEALEAEKQAVLDEAAEKEYAYQECLRGKERGRRGMMICGIAFGALVISGAFIRLSPTVISSILGIIAFCFIMGAGLYVDWWVKYSEPMRYRRAMLQLNDLGIQTLKDMRAAAKAAEREG
jgi:hypothetical protein